MLIKRTIATFGFILAFSGFTVLHADAPYTATQNESYEEQEYDQSTYNQQDYRSDYELFVQMYNNIDQQSVTAISINNDKLNHIELNRVVKGIKAVSNQARNLNFKTEEGQQVQQDFIENNDFSMQGFIKHSQLIKDKNLQKQLSTQAAKLELQLSESLSKLKNLAEQ